MPYICTHFVGVKKRQLIWMKFVFTPCSIKNELFTKRGYFMLISLFIFHYAGMGYEYLIYIIYKQNKKKTGINNFKKEYNTHTTIRTYTFRGSICYILYITWVCDVSPVFDFSEIDIVLLILAQTLKHSFEHTKHDVEK